MHGHVHVSILAVSLCLTLIAGTQQNGNQKAAREIAEQFTEMMERRNLEAEGYQLKQQKSRIVIKLTKWQVRPAKTEISLGIRPVWSESSLSAWRKLGSLTTH